jgi:hypothetical protein
MTIPEMTIEHIGLLALALVIGLVLGWFFRGERPHTRMRSIAPRNCRIPSESRWTDAKN